MANLSENTRTAKLNFTIEIPCLENEQWVIVNGWQFYAVSDKGRLFSLRSGGLIIPQKARKSTEHCKVRLSNNGKWTGIYIHRLVAMNFIPNPLNKPYINHIDANPKNNCVENIEWATAKENTQHSYRMGLQIMPTNRAIGEERSKKLKNKDVVEIKNLIAQNKGNAEIGKLFNVTGDTIRSIRLGKSWSHIDGSIPSLIDARIAVDKTV